MELLGPPLDYLFRICRYSFSLRTVLMLADQMISILERLHHNNIVYRDIKHANWCIGQNDKSNEIYLVDFGLSRIHDEGYFTKNRVAHKKYNGMIGTKLFCSINAHLGLQQSPRDDIEAIGYLLVYLLKGTLPWAQLELTEEENDSIREIRVKESKIKVPVKTICSECPMELSMLIDYGRALRFHEQPNHAYLRKMLAKCAVNNNIIYDYQYDWIIRKNSEHESKSFSIISTVTKLWKRISKWSY